MVDRVEFNTVPDTTGDRPKGEAEAAAAAAAAAAAPAGDRPAWLPDNFKSVEDYTKSYGELQSSFTKLSQEIADLKKGAPPADDKAKAEADAKAKTAEEEAAKALEGAGVDIEAISARTWAKGSIEEADKASVVAALTKSGIPNAADLVDNYVAGQMARREANQNGLLAVVGGRENFDKMATWAKASGDQKLATEYNAAYDSGDFGKMQVALTALFGAYEKANGKDPSIRLTGDTSPASGSDGTAYRDSSEMVKDMSDPRYKTSPAFRDDVARKLSRSKF